MDITEKIIQDAQAVTGMATADIQNALKNTRITLVENRLFITGEPLSPEMIQTIQRIASANAEFDGIVDNTQNNNRNNDAGRLFATRIPGWEAVPQKDITPRMAARAALLNAQIVRQQDRKPEL